MGKMVYIVTDAMEQFQGVFESYSDAQEQLYIRHGTPSSDLEDVDGTVKLTFPNGETYKIEAHTPSAHKYR